MSQRLGGAGYNPLLSFLRSFGYEGSAADAATMCSAPGGLGHSIAHVSFCAPRKRVVRAICS